MSPEQCRGGSKVVDGRSDIYSLGCILYEMLCGSPPFVRDGMGDLIVAHVSEAPEPLRARVPTIPPALDALVMQMLAKAPTDRPQTMDAVAGALTDSLFALGVHAPLVEIRPRKPVVVPVLPDAFSRGGADAVVEQHRAHAARRFAVTGADHAVRRRAGRQHARAARPGAGAPAGRREPRSSTTFRNAVGEKAHDESMLPPRRSSVARATMILIAVLGIGGVGALVALRGQIFGSATTAEPDPPSAAEDPRRAQLPDR